MGGFFRFPPAFSVVLLVWGGLGASALAAQSAHVGTITRVQGEAQVFTDPGATIRGPPPHVLFEGEYYSVREARAGDRVKNGNIVRTAPGGQAKIVFDNGDQIQVGPATAYRVHWENSGESERKGGSQTLRLLYGKLRNIVSKSGPRSNMTVRAGDAVMGVRGTDFYVRLSGVKQALEVTALRGSVSLSAASGVKSVEVATGYSATVASAAPGAVAPTPEVRQTTREELDRIRKSTTVPKDERAIPPEAASKVQALESKAVEATLEDIKAHDPKAYEQALQRKAASSEDLNDLTVESVAKTAPGALRQAKPTRVKLLAFGLSERFMFQPTYSGANLSAMASWHPTYRFSEALRLAGMLGFAGMRATKGNFPAIRAQVGASVLTLHPRFYPEVLVGTETWATTGGGTHLAVSMNAHYSLPSRFFRADATHLLRALDTITIGYQTILIPSAQAHQLVLGLRFAFWPDEGKEIL